MAVIRNVRGGTVGLNEEDRLALAGTIQAKRRRS